MNYFPLTSFLTFCDQTGGWTALKTQMESKKLFADEFPFQSLWKLGQFIIILQWSEIHFVKCCVFFPCVCVVSPPTKTSWSHLFCVVLFSTVLFIYLFFLKLCFPSIARVRSFLAKKYSGLFGFSGACWAHGAFPRTGKRIGSLRG